MHYNLPFLSLANLSIRISFLLFFCLSVLNSNFAQRQTELYPGQSGATLLRSLQNDFSANGPLDYGVARDSLYFHVWRKDNKINCQYTDFEVDLPTGVDPSSHIFNQGINTEHLYPRSKGADRGNALADMHHLYPSRENVNGDRASLPFGEINDNQTNKWYYLNRTLSSPPSSQRDLYSESTGSQFEPREIRKGDIARAMMYFYTIYRSQALAEDNNFFASQQSTLCQWNDLDPVDADEYERNQKIQQLQGNFNPFILDCTLANRLGYCNQISTACLLVDTDNAQNQQIELYPNPSTGFFTVRNLAIGQLYLYDMLGRELEQYTVVNANAEQQFSLPTSLSTGWYTLVSPHTNWQKRIYFSK